VDSVMLERLLENGKEEAGIYAQSYRIFDASSQFSFLFAMLLLPMFSRMIRLKQNVNDLVRMALPLLLVAGLSLAISCNFYNHEIIDLLYKTHAPYSSRILGILMIGFLFVSTSYIYGTLLTANNNLKQLNILAASTVVINISLNLALIPRYHALGAAFSSLISQGFYAILQVVLSTRLLKIPLNGDILVRVSGFLAFNIIAGYFSLKIPGWVPGFFTLLISCLISSFLLGLIQPVRLLNLIRDDKDMIE